MKMIKPNFLESMAKRVSNYSNDGWPIYAQLGFSNAAEQDINTYADMVGIGPVIILPPCSTNNITGENAGYGGVDVLTWYISFPNVPPGQTINCMMFSVDLPESSTVLPYIMKFESL